MRALIEEKSEGIYLVRIYDDNGMPLEAYLVDKIEDKRAEPTEKQGEKSSGENMDLLGHLL